MIRRLLFFISFLCISTFTWAQALIINEYAGWLESATVKWQPVEGAESYNVYFSGEGINNQIIDDKLIRSYGTYFRADILGIKAGQYKINVAPVIMGEEGESAETGFLTVEAHDRTGFSFSNGQTPGAYKTDGTPKGNVVILYITENTKNKVTLDVTGANVNPCVGLQTILDGFKKGKDSRPLIVRLVGQITDLDYMNKGDVVLENGNSALGCITIEGVGDDAVADGWGIRVKNASNIEIRNIGLMNCDSDEGDNIGLQQDNYYIWVHHCDFFYGDAGSDSDQAKGDGALDSKRSGYVTISYNHFWDSGKSNLLGNGIENPEYLSYHHNWYDHSDSRHPRVRSHSVHVYNNYYDGNAKYGIGSTNASSVFVEANYFRNCKYPMLISMQGSDVFDEDLQGNEYSDMPTFSKEDGGIIKAFNNYMTEQRRFVPYNSQDYPNSSVDFDAYVATNRDEFVSSNVTSYQGGNTYNNFDVNNSVMYVYTADSPEMAKDKVVEYAGRVNGGDFTWSFNNEIDDASYDVHTELKAKLVDYQTSLVSVQNDSVDSIEGGSEEPKEPEYTEGDKAHNFTISGLNSSFYSIMGNLSDSKGTVNYNELVLTQCLKIESSTSIKFVVAEESSLTLVFNSDFTGGIKINGTSYHATDGVLTITLPAGLYEITKEDTANLYYMNTSGSNDNTTEISNTVSLDINIYPNPVFESLTISSEIKINRVDVYSLTGILVKSASNNIRTITMSDLSPANYLVVIHIDKDIMKRIIIKK